MYPLSGTYQEILTNQIPRDEGSGSQQNEQQKIEEISICNFPSNVIDLITKFLPIHNPKHLFSINRRMLLSRNEIFQKNSDIVSKIIKNAKQELAKIPESLSKIVTKATISSLDLSGTYFDRQELRNDLCSLGFFHQLKRLDISCAKNIDLCSLPNALEELNCSDFETNDNDIFKLIKNLTQLKTLKLSNVSGTTDATIEMLPKSIENLYLSSCELTSELIQKLHCFTNLKKLELNHIKAKSSPIGPFPKSLEELIISSYRLNTEEIQKLGCLTNLKRLEVSDIEITDTTIELLSKSFETLSLSSCKFIDEAAKKLHCFTNVKNLDLGMSSGVTCAAVKILPQSLEELYLGYCDLTDEHILNLQNLTKLKKLDLRGNNTITGKNIGILSQSLEALNLFQCELTDDDILMLQNLTTLKILILNENLKITGKNIEILPKSLEELRLPYCNVTDEHILKLQDFPNLKILDISNYDESHGYSLKTLESLPSSLRQLTVSRFQLDQKYFKDFIKNRPNLIINLGGTLRQTIF